ncbi:response regulator transcription factor [Microlunatus capsulatus]|uniref:DNA-binding CsgD family transcriptional regulator n=1 Tax=Microlunatus capsulatus TaxID=99117 RepID=A0ABS4ZCX5_9ACTN|nr:helix-turn-helix transcriptional regulator [Microlunatus capsulatus]MBP2418886.1 DNA-binding CsgD family transcriptional regulator [Microlunatus capsulatus]
MDVATRSAHWLGEVVDLMRGPSPVMPVAALLTSLSQTFDVSGSSWDWFDPDGSFGMVMDPAEIPQIEQETLDRWLTGELFDTHALLQWFRVTGDLRPQTTARVPTRILARRRRLPLERALAAMAMEHQLSVVYRQHGPTHRAFVLARGGSDFSDDDLVVAQVVQRSLAALDHQVAVMQRMTRPAAAADLGLTGRELAVLQLMAEGTTIRRAARELACSPRTVEKHLENAYRRLGVRDRLNAVRVLHITGTTTPVLATDHLTVTGSGDYRGPVRPAVRTSAGPTPPRAP